MPIKPENRGRYPADWPLIRERIRKRAGDKCEECGVPNHVYVYRDRDGWHQVALGGDGCLQPTLSVAWAVREGLKPTRIVCTVAHLDHTPEHCEDDNLRFWCQRCHLLYDQTHHAETAYQTRRAGRAIHDLFD